MDKTLTWFIRIWGSAVVLLNIVGVAGIIITSPSFTAAWLEITGVYSLFNIWTHGLNVALLSPAAFAYWWRDRRRKKRKKVVRLD